jgi:hypothetical protein
VVVSRDEAPIMVARSEVPTDQWADGRCSCGWWASASHLSLEQEECKIIIFLRTPKNWDKEKIVL